MKTCCGEERTTRYCPDCGTYLRDEFAEDLCGLLEHCHRRYTEKHSQAWGTKKEPTSGQIVACDKWRSWYRLLAEKLNMRW